MGRTSTSYSQQPRQPLTTGSSGRTAVLDHVPQTNLLCLEIQIQPDSEGRFPEGFCIGLRPRSQKGTPDGNY